MIRLGRVPGSWSCNGVEASHWVRFGFEDRRCVRRPVDGRTRTLRPRRRQGQGRLRQHAVRPVFGARHRHSRRLCARGQAEWRQARWLAGGGDRQRRPVQARRGASTVRAQREARQGRLHDRRGVLQHHARRAARGAGQQGHLHQPERRSFFDGGQGLQPAVLRRVVAERCVPRGGGRVREPARTEERVPARAQLPSRQGFARRVQAHLQGRDRRRELHQARPARLRRRARRNPRREAAGTLHLPARRHGHQLHQAVRRRGPRQGHPARAAGLFGRPGHHHAGGRADGRPVQHGALVARLHERGEPEVHGRVPEGIQARAVGVRVAGLRRGAAHQRRGARRERQDRRPGSGAQGAARGEVRFGARCVQVQHEPVPDPELLRAHGGQRWQGRPDQQVARRADSEEPWRRLRRGNAACRSEVCHPGESRDPPPRVAHRPKVDPGLRRDDESWGRSP